MLSSTPEMLFDSISWHLATLLKPRRSYIEFIAFCCVSQFASKGIAKLFELETKSFPHDKTENTDDRKKEKKSFSYHVRCLGLVFSCSLKVLSRLLFGGLNEPSVNPLQAME